MPASACFTDPVGGCLKRCFILVTQPAKASLSAMARPKSATPSVPDDWPVRATRRASGLRAWSMKP